MGWRESPIRITQVLLVHDVWFSTYVGGLLGVVLPNRRRELLYSVSHRRGNQHSEEHPDLDLRGNVHRLCCQSSDVPFPYVATRCSHPGTHTGFGHLGCNLVEVGNIRFRTNRNSNSSRSSERMGSLDWLVGRHWNYLWRIGMFGADRHEASDCVLLCGSHGLRHVGNFHVD